MKHYGNDRLPFKWIESVSKITRMTMATTKWMWKKAFRLCLVFMAYTTIYGITKYFKNPGKFDPERFSQENKDRHLFAVRCWAKELYWYVGGGFCFELVCLSGESSKNVTLTLFPPLSLPFSLSLCSLIGSRFALMELKAILYHLLLNFSFEPNEKTNIPIKLKKVALSMQVDGLHLEMKPRQ